MIAFELNSGVKQGALLSFFALVLIAILSPICSAQTRSSVLTPAQDPRGEPELTVCTQNLENWGTYRAAAARTRNLTPELYAEKGRALAKRFATAGCDLIALQEVLGSNEQEATEGLVELAKFIRAATNRFFEAKVGQTNDAKLRNGFLVAKDRAEVLNLTSYYKVELPKISEKQRPRFFSRGPVEIQLSVRGNGADVPSKVVTVITFHFKSRRGFPGDPAGVEFESYRMEMAEALRRVVEQRHARAFASGETLLVLLGDRNSNFDTASARILEGTLKLTDFQGSAPCRLSKRGVPLCKADSASPQRLFSVLTMDPQTRHRTGTYTYKGEHSWLDDILLPAESLPFAWDQFDSSGDFASEVVYLPQDASDHGLAYARLNW